MISDNYMYYTSVFILKELMIDDCKNDGQIRTVRTDSLWHVDLSQRLLNKHYKAGLNCKNLLPKTANDH